VGQLAVGLGKPPSRPAIVGLRFEPVAGVVLLSAVTAGSVASHPLRWRLRLKARLTLPEGEAFRPDLSEDGLLDQIQIDLGR